MNVKIDSKYYLVTNKGCIIYMDKTMTPLDNSTIDTNCEPCDFTSDDAKDKKSCNTIVVYDHVQNEAVNGYEKKDINVDVDSKKILLMTKVLIIMNLIKS